VLRANANGYLLAKRKGGDNLDKDNSINDGTNWDKLDESTNEGKSNIQAIVTPATDNQSTGIGGAKYKGFSIIDRAKKVRKKVIGGDNDRSMVIGKNIKKTLRSERAAHCDRGGIDNLRKLEVKDASGNEVSELSVFKDIKRVEKKDLFGFEPGDINEYGRYEGFNLKKAESWKVVQGGKSTKDHRMTKIKFKLRKCDNLEKVLQLLLGDFENELHLLNEFGSHQTTLEEYYDLIKNNVAVPLDGKNYNDDNKDNKKVMKQIDWIYLSLKKWAVI